MKAITLWQPHASLIPTGDKEFETRPMSFNYRGPLVIHAGKHFTAEEQELCQIEPFRSCLARAGFNEAPDLPLGAAIGKADLVAIFRAEDVVGRISAQERAFGNYQPRRFAWQLENPYVFPEPIPMRGRQGLWTLTPEEMALLPFPYNVSGKVYTIGYSGRTPEEIFSYAVELDATVLDIRFSPRSRVPHWTGPKLSEMFALKGRASLYHHIQSLGNRNYKNGGPIELVDYDAGKAVIRTVLEAGRSVILMCACSNASQCHRTTVANLLRTDGHRVEELPGPGKTKKMEGSTQLGLGL